MATKAMNKILFLFLIFFSSALNATVCRPYPNWKTTNISYNLDSLFTSGNNYAGAVVTLPGHDSGVNVQAICDPSYHDNYTYRSYVTDFPVTRVIDGYKFLSLNDYLEGAMSITDSVVGTFYPPVEYKKMGYWERIHKGSVFSVQDTNLIFKLRVKRRFIGTVFMPQRPIFKVYVTTTDNDPLRDIVYTISFGGVINVPQNCVINSGADITFDFGNISSLAFSRAGAGNRPQGVNPQWKTIGIQCTNTEQQAILSIRLEGSKTAGDALVSDNPDLGFVVANEGGVPLRPNDQSSFITFRTGESDGSQVQIGAWPVSITGRKPSPGPFISTGYLRIDFK